MNRNCLLPPTLAVLPMLLLALLPQAYLWSIRGENWSAPYVDFKGDEASYAAYVNARIDGRPRRSDPFTGQDDEPGAPQPESLFSIQFLPAYALSTTARAFGLSVVSVFLLLRCLASCASALALFWLIFSLTKNSLLAATGAVIVLCAGTLLQWLYSSQPGDAVIALPFLRRYVPAFAFPFYLAFCAVVWQMLGNAGKSVGLLWAFAAGLIFGVLVFSYFYLWTAAIALLICLMFLWIIVRPEGWRSGFRALSILSGLCALVLIPYFLLLTEITTADAARTALVPTHRPDFFRKTEFLGAIVLLTLGWHARRGVIDFSRPQILFTMALALVPFVVFNQQIITGHSLQPYHYGLFVANYSALIATVLAAWFSFSARVKTPPKLLFTVLIGIAILAIASGAYETILRLRGTTVEYRTANDAKQLGIRISKLGHSLENQKVDTRSVILATDPFVAEYLPTMAPQSVLWALHMFYLPRSASAEDKHRFLNYLYYTGRDPLTLYEQKQTLDDKEKYILKFLVTLMEYDYGQSGRKLPIKDADRLALLNDYRRVIASFDRERATHPVLHYLVVSKVEDGTVANLDRWYERDSGEQFGQFVLYRLKLRP